MLSYRLGLLSAHSVIDADANGEIGGFPMILFCDADSSNQPGSLVISVLLPPGKGEMKVVVIP